MTAILENAKEIVVDKWGTLNTVSSPGKLPESHSPNNQNVWMDEKPGSVVTANGYDKLGELPSGNPPTGFLEYAKSSDGTRKLIVTDGQTVYWTTDYVTFTSIITGLAQYFQVRMAVIRDKVWFTNGSDAVRVWDGSSVTVLDGTASTPNVPRGKFISYHDERVWLFGITGDTSALRFSALTDSGGSEIAPDNSAAWPSDNELQISEADADAGTGMFLYRGYLYCSKQYSVWRVTGYDEYTYTRTKTRASTGTRFQESIQILDNLVHFIGVDGLYTFNGEDAIRISDIIDPASAEEGVFAFRNLQQQLLNNQFWTVTDTADFNAGTKPAVLSSANDTLTLVPADDSQADFEAGVLKTNITTTLIPGSIRLTRKSTGSDSSGIDLASLQLVEVGDISGVVRIGDEPQNLTDNVGSSVFGFRKASGPSGSTSLPPIDVHLSDIDLVNRVTFENVITDQNINIEVYVSPDGTASNFTLVATQAIPASALSQSFDLTFTPVVAGLVRLSWGLSIGRQAYMGKFRVYGSAFNTSGEFTSKTIDYGVTPDSFGSLAASIGDGAGLPGSAITFYTQSSSDGSTWDSAVAVTNGSSIGSTLRRYLRWGALFTSNGNDSWSVSKVFVGGTYVSEIHDAGAGINQWSAFQSVLNKFGQTIDAFYRAASTEAGVSAQSWTAIVSGAIPNTSVSNRYIQIKFQLSTTNIAQVPSIDSFTVNWVLATGLGVNTLQNVASIVILNRYWLAAATLGATENDIVIVRGKSTFGSPWHKKDFAFLSFGRFLDYYVAGSSLDGSIYRLEVGYSKDGEAMNSFYETADFDETLFQIKGKEILVTCDRSGPYDLTVGYSTDGGQTYTERAIDLTRDDGDSLSFTKKLNVSYMSDSVRFKVGINAADQPFSVDEIRSPYKLTPQRGALAA